MVKLSDQRHGLWGIQLIQGQVEEGPVEDTKEPQSEKQEQNRCSRWSNEAQKPKGVELAGEKG